MLILIKDKYGMAGNIIRQHIPSLSHPISKHRGLHTMFKTKDYVFYCKAVSLSIIRAREQIAEANKGFFETNPDCLDENNYVGNIIRAESLNVNILDELCTFNAPTFLVISYSMYKHYILYPRRVREFCANNRLIRTHKTKCELTRNGELLQMCESIYLIPRLKTLFTPLKEWLNEVFQIETKVENE